MHLLATTENMLAALQTVYRAIPTRTPLPILSGIYLEAREDTVYLTATDLEHGIRTSVPVNVKSPGNAVLPAREITELMRRLAGVPEVEIHVDPETHIAVISYGQSELTLNGFSPEEYPQLPDKPGEPLLTLPQSLLRGVLRQVLYAVAQEEHRPIFTGVLFEFTDGVLNLVATDTHRLALRTVPLEEDPGRLIKVVVPGKTLNELTKLPLQDDEKVSVSLSENQIFFLTEKVHVVTRLLAGEFPNYKMVIPQNVTSEVTVPTRDLLEAVDRALLLSTQRRQTIFLQLRGNNLTLLFHSETGRIREELVVQGSGEDIDVGFNGRYLTDALKSISTEQVKLELTGPSTPAMIKPVDEENYISVLVPAVPQEQV